MRKGDAERQPGGVPLRPCCASRRPLLFGQPVSLTYTRLSVESLRSSEPLTPDTAFRIAPSRPRRSGSTQTTPTVALNQASTVPWNHFLEEPERQARGSKPIHARDGLSSAPFIYRHQYSSPYPAVCARTGKGTRTACRFQSDP